MRFCCAAACLAAVSGLSGQTLKPETVDAFNCYVQSAERRMEARKTFLRADGDASLNAQLVRGQKIQTVEGNGPNPHKLPGGQLYHWIGSIFIQGTTLERTVRMLQDYDHRFQYFPEIVGASKLLCRSGEDRFGFSMQLKEPAVIDTENDVVWERVDPRRMRCRSYSTSVREVGKDHRYLQRLYSYWRFAEADNGVHVEAQTITLSGEFGGLTRAIGSLMGINPEKSLRKTLTSMRESVLKPGAQFALPPSGAPQCGKPVQAGGCAQAPNLE